MSVSKDTSNKTTSNFPEEKDILPKLNDGEKAAAGFFNTLINGATRTAESIFDPIDYDGIAWPSGVTSIDDSLREMSRIAHGSFVPEIHEEVIDISITAFLQRHLFYTSYKTEILFPTGRFTKTSSAGANPNKKIVIFTGWQNNVPHREGVQVSYDKPPTMYYSLNLEEFYSYGYSFVTSTTGELTTGGVVSNGMGISFNYNPVAPYEVIGFSYDEVRSSAVTTPATLTNPPPKNPLIRNSSGEKLVWCAMELPF